MNEEYKVWECKIVISGDSQTPPGFDYPPRMAAQKAIEDAGFVILMNSSGWGGSLNNNDIEYLKKAEKQGRQEMYIAGLMDIPEDVEH